MPAVEIHKPIERHSLSDNLLIHDHGAVNVAAATLRVFGRRAIRQYASDRGGDLELLIPILNEAIGDWAAARGGSLEVVNLVAGILDDRMLPVDYPPTPTPTPAPARRTTTRGKPLH